MIRRLLEVERESNDLGLLKNVLNTETGFEDGVRVGEVPYKIYG